jgi:hypothetical protein
VASQGGSGGFGAALAAGVFVFGASVTAGGGALGGGGGVQAEPVRDRPAGLADAVVVIPDAGLGAVLAGEHGDDVDVVGCVPDGDPADGVVVLAGGGQAGVGHDLLGGMCPFSVRQHPVAGGGARDAAPDGFGGGGGVKVGGQAGEL